MSVVLLYLKCATQRSRHFPRSVRIKAFFFAGVIQNLRKLYVCKQACMLCIAGMRMVAGHMCTCPCMFDRLSFSNFLKDSPAHVEWNSVMKSAQYLQLGAACSF